MAGKQLCLCLLLALIFLGWAKKQPVSSFVDDCSKCIQYSLSNAWCTAPHTKLRCHTVKRLLRAGCDLGYIYNPQTLLQVVKNDSSTESADAKALLLQPQELSLHLRPHGLLSFPLTITRLSDQPVSELIMDTSPVPAGVNITFSRIMIGNMVVQVNVEAAQGCTESDDPNQNRTQPWSVYITPRGFSQSVKLTITMECECGCMRNRRENSPACSGHGALVCGQCQCYRPYMGQHCRQEPDSFFSQDDNACRSGPDAQLCSGRGTCVEDGCICDRRENPHERYSGQFCQCSNFDCPRHNNRICGGHGRCECGQCICDAAWTGDQCECSLETASCMATNRQLCYGKGLCQCGSCKCEPPYAGPTCEHCPDCQGTCEQHMACVECQAFGTGAKEDRCEEECSYLALKMVNTTEELFQSGGTERYCKMISQEDSCWFYYTISQMPSGQQSTVVRVKQCPQTL